MNIIVCNNRKFVRAGKRESILSPPIVESVEITAERKIEALIVRSRRAGSGIEPREFVALNRTDIPGRSAVKQFLQKREICFFGESGDRDKPLRFVVVKRGNEFGHRELRLALLFARMGGGDETTKSRVGVAIARDERDRRVIVHRELGAGDELDVGKVFE